MQKIKMLIQNNQIEDALKMIDKEILDVKNHNTDKYHQLFFAKGIVNITQFESSNPLNNVFAKQAKEDFAHADNTYKTLHGHENKTYTEAIIYAGRIFSNLNTKQNVSTLQRVPRPSL